MMTQRNVVSSFSKDWLSTNKGVTPKTWPTLLAKLGKVENLVAVIEEIKSTTVTA